MKNKKKFMLVSMLVLSLFIVSCTQENNQSDGTNSQGNEISKDNEKNKDNKNTESSKNTIKESYKDAINPVDIFDKYVEKHPNTKVDNLSFDKEFNSYIYKIEGYDGNKEYGIKIDPMSGEILKEYTEMDGENYGEIIKKDLENVLNLVEETLKESGENASLDEWEVDYDDGEVILEVSINIKGMENLDYKYNLRTGELIEKDN